MYSSSGASGIDKSLSMLIAIEAVLGHIEWAACSAFVSFQSRPLVPRSFSGRFADRSSRSVGSARTSNNHLRASAPLGRLTLSFQPSTRGGLGSPASPEQSLVRHASSFTIGLASGEWNEVDPIDLPIDRQVRPHPRLPAVANTSKW